MQDHPRPSCLLFVPAAKSFVVGVALLLGPTVLSAASDSCWVESPAIALPAGKTVSDPKLTSLVRAVSRAEALMKADPVLHDIGGVRFYARRSIATLDGDSNGARTSYTGNVWVTLNPPDVWTGPGCALDTGRADYLNTRAAEISFNEVGRILSAAGIADDPSMPPVVNMTPEAIDTFRTTGILRGANETLRAFRTDGKPVLEPRSVKDHLAFWERTLQELSAAGGGAFADPELAVLRAHRAGLSERALHGQVWTSAESVEVHMWGYAEPGTDGAVPVFGLAPDLLSMADGSGRVFLVVVSAYAPEDDAVGDALRAWVDGFDAARARDLVGGHAS